MFNEIHEIQSKRHELQVLNMKLIKKARKERKAAVYKCLVDADGLLDELGDLYGACIDIIEEE